MKTIITPLLLLGAAMFISACNCPEPFNVDEARKGIEEANAIYCEAIRQGNIEGVLSIYSDDATVIPPEGQIVKGKQAVGEVYKQLFGIGLKEVVFTTLEVDGTGDLAYETGKSRVRIQPEGMESFIDSSKYIVIWKRQDDGIWKVQADIWNLY